MGIVGVPGDKSTFCPADECRLVDAKARGRLTFRQPSAVAKSIIARAESVFVDEIGDTQGSEASLAPAASSRSAGTKSLLVEHVSDLGRDVGIEKCVDELDEPGRCLHLLRG